MERVEFDPLRSTDCGSRCALTFSCLLWAWSSSCICGMFVGPGRARVAMIRNRTLTHTRTVDDKAVLLLPLISGMNHLCDGLSEVCGTYKMCALFSGLVLPI